MNQKLLVLLSCNVMVLFSMLIFEYVHPEFFILETGFIIGRILISVFQNMRYNWWVRQNGDRKIKFEISKTRRLLDDYRRKYNVFEERNRKILYDEMGRDLDRRIQVFNDLNRRTDKILNDIEELDKSGI